MTGLRVKLHVMLWLAARTFTNSPVQARGRASFRSDQQLLSRRPSINNLFTLAGASAAVVPGRRFGTYFEVLRSIFAKKIASEGIDIVLRRHDASSVVAS